MEKEILKLFLEGHLNKTDLLIVYNIFLSDEDINMRYLSIKVKIAPVNLWRHINKLEEFNFIKVLEQKRGKPKFPKLTKEGKTLARLWERLNE